MEARKGGEGGDEEGGRREGRREEKNCDDDFICRASSVCEDLMDSISTTLKKYQDDKDKTSGSLDVSREQQIPAKESWYSSSSPPFFMLLLLLLVRSSSYAPPRTLLLFPSSSSSSYAPPFSLSWSYAPLSLLRFPPADPPHECSKQGAEIMRRRRRPKSQPLPRPPT